MKRAAIIITDEPVRTAKGELNLCWCVTRDDYPEDWNTFDLEPSEQLLEDLWNLVDECEALDIPHLRNAAARVRELLPGENDDG